MTTLFSSLWRGTEQQISRILDKVDDTNIHNSIKPGMRSVGIMFLHIGESQFSFAQTLFGTEIPSFTPQTLGRAENPVGVVSAEELKAFVRKSCETLTLSIAKCPDDAWNELVQTPWKVEMPRNAVMGFAMNHTMQHIGQIIQALKYGE